MRSISQLCAPDMFVNKIINDSNVTFEEKSDITGRKQKYRNMLVSSRLFLVDIASKLRFTKRRKMKMFRFCVCTCIVVNHTHIKAQFNHVQARRVGRGGGRGRKREQSGLVRALEWNLYMCIYYVLRFDNISQVFTSSYHYSFYMVYLGSCIWYTTE